MYSKRDLWLLYEFVCVGTCCLVMVESSGILTSRVNFSIYANFSMRIFQGLTCFSIKKKKFREKRRKIRRNIKVLTLLDHLLVPSLIFFINIPLVLGTK